MEHYGTLWNTMKHHETKTEINYELKIRSSEKM